MLKIFRKIRRAVTLDEPTYHDMFLNPGERFFARLYLHSIREVIRARSAGPLDILDAGCQAGRLAIPLAQEGHRVTGVDTSRVALSKAARHARDSGVSLRLIRADLGAWLPKQKPGSFDMVLCNEVLYLRENWRDLLQGLIRLLRPGGLSFISHRPPSFAQSQESGEGQVEGSYYNWQSREELERIYREQGIEALRIAAIWDIRRMVNPEKVSEEERERLYREETASAADSTADGRYLLVCGRKR